MRVESFKIYDNVKKRMNPFEFTSDVVNTLNHIFIIIYFCSYILHRELVEVFFLDSPIKFIIAQL